MPYQPPRRNLRTAASALRKLLSNGDDTTQVFVIMRNLNGDQGPKHWRQLMRSPAGPRLAYRRVELADRFSDADWVASFAPGTVGAAYRRFLEETGYTAAGLAEISNLEGAPLIEHPHAWFGRRTRDVHDIWHVLTGYKADETLGEAALVAFSYAQTGGLGWAFIAAGAALKSLKVAGNGLFARAVWEGYRNGRRATWLMGEDYEALMHEPIEAARQRLRIADPVAYAHAQAELGEAMASYASTGKAMAA